MAILFFVCNSVIRDRSQQLEHRSSDIWRIGSFLPTLASVSCMHTASGNKVITTFHGHGVRNGWLLLCLDLKLMYINYSLLSRSSSGSCKPIIESRVLKYLFQADSACSIVIQMGRQILDVLSSAFSPQSYFSPILLFLSFLGLFFLKIIFVFIKIIHTHSFIN